MDRTETRGWLAVTVKVPDTVWVGALKAVPALISLASGFPLISLTSSVTTPSSATFSTPRLAMPPDAQMVVSELCVAPITWVKCAPPGMKASVMSSTVHSPSKVMV